MKLENKIFIREFDQESDDINELTNLLNIAYKQLADLGFQYVASYQGPETTRERILGAKCFVCYKSNRLVGTITLYKPGIKKGCAWYEEKPVGVVGQFGVLPAYQGEGIGTILLDHIENQARKMDIKEISLDTAEGATHLVNFYCKSGFTLVAYTDWEMTNYRSAVFSKKIH
ncbi:GNAT family N-acetyltransferase [Alkalihalophilus sp. As8PL]|uniref:GNAT family N-acetyltransferase n=1 Tax=Alkalihalophilus sp. As8PL TaxID=3237103 RepID=A0AB39BV80_9BACI